MWPDLQLKRTPVIPGRASWRGQGRGEPSHWEVRGRVRGGLTLEIEWQQSWGAVWRTRCGDDGVGMMGWGRSREKSTHWHLVLCLASCGILVLWPGVKSRPPALDIQSLNHWTCQGSPPNIIFSPNSPWSCRSIGCHLPIVPKSSASCVHTKSLSCVQLFATLWL